jgi:L-ascorbate metabolism protein UlaG (beta-lactamase superfamily)
MRANLLTAPCALLAALSSLVACDVGRMIGGNASALFATPQSVPTKITRPIRTDARLAVLWIGHATTLVQIDDKIVLTDPVFTRTVGQLSARLVDPGLDVENLPPVDAVLISHMHPDHLSLGTLEEIEPRVKRLFVPKGGVVYVPDFRFDVEELATWESFDDAGLRISAVPVDHLGARYGADSAWMTTSFTGYVVEYHGMKVYFGGDTAYDANDFRETGRRFPEINLALLPISPIRPEGIMQSMHQNPEQALDAFADLGARVMVPIHFETFVDGAEDIGEPRARLETEARARKILGTRVWPLRIGEQRVVIAK